MQRSKMVDRRARERQHGSAMVIALLVMAMLTLLGVSFLLMGETENRIAQNEKRGEQALYTAESGVRMVKRWFDRPGDAGNLRNPPLAVIDRSLRMIDADGDPATAPVAADGTAARPFYKQGIDEDADGADDVFRKPYRGSLEHTLLGTEDGPDMRIDEAASPAAKAFLTDLSGALMGNYPAAAQGIRARVVRIDVYAPPYVEQAGAWLRFGMATVKVIGRIYRVLPDGTEQSLGQRMVKVVLNEIPFNPSGDLGPLHSCDYLTWNGEFSVHWGIATAVNDADLHNNHDKQAVSLARVAPPDRSTDLLWGWDNPADFAAYKAAIDGLIVEDPWVRFMTEGTWLDAPNANPQPFPFSWVPGTPLDDGDIPYHPAAVPGPWHPNWWDGSHSNMFQHLPVGCPEFDYELWKAIAQSGSPFVHYYTWEAGTTFKENGLGAAIPFRDITDDQTGLFFFDTADGVAPYDDAADGEYDNLTPKIKIQGGTWGVRGMLYLNAFSFQSHGVKGRDATFKAPGEPFQDADQNRRWDPGEDWINLDYPTKLSGPGSDYVADAGDTMQDDGLPGGAAIRNSRGPAIDDEANIWGIMYNNGYYDATGNATYYGSVVSKSGIGEFDPSAGTPDHYWDESLRDDWPPDGWNLPRVAITRWETDM